MRSRELPWGQHFASRRVSSVEKEKGGLEEKTEVPWTRVTYHLASVRHPLVELVQTVPVFFSCYFIHAGSSEPSRGRKRGKTDQTV